MPIGPVGFIFHMLLWVSIHKDKSKIQFVGQLAYKKFTENRKLAVMTELSRHDSRLKQVIANRIKELREQTNLTQSEFAQSHLIDRQTLNRWESGRGVTIYTIDRFCKMANCTLQEFFNTRAFKADK